MWLRLLLLTGAVALAGGTLADRRPALDGDDSGTAMSEPAATLPNPLETPREIPTATHMHAKLTATQHVLAGLVCEDFAQIVESARQLRGIAENVPHRESSQSADDRAYEHFRHEFARLAEELERTAVARNLEGSAYVHGNLTATCIGCHQRVRSSDGEIELLRRQQ